METFETDSHAYAATNPNCMCVVGEIGKDVQLFRGAFEVHERIPLFEPMTASHIAGSCRLAVNDYLY